MKQFNKTLTLIGLLVFSFSGLIAQQTDTLFVDSFTDNKYQWEIGDNEKFALKVENGSYIFECKTEDEARTTSRNLPVDMTRDFVIETSFKKLSGVDNNGFGLMLGKPGEEKEYNFIISGNGQFNIITWKDGAISDIVKWTKSDIIKQNDNAINKLKIEKTGKTLKLSINDKYVARAPFNSDYFGEETKIGFIIHQKIKISVDDFVVYQTQAKHPVKDNKPKLSAENLRFETPMSGSILEALQRGEIKFDLVNSGSALASDIEIRIEPISSSGNLMFESSKSITALPEGDTIAVAVPVYADEWVDSSEREFQITISEITNYEADIKTINFETRSTYQSPQYSDVDDFIEEGVETCANPSFGCCVASVVLIIIAALVN